MKKIILVLILLVVVFALSAKEIVITKYFSFEKKSKNYRNDDIKAVAEMYNAKVQDLVFDVAFPNNRVQVKGIYVDFLLDEKKAEMFENYSVN